MAWNFLVQLAVMAVTSVASYAMSEKPDDATTANKVGRPRAEDGMVIPVIFGPVILKDLCVIGFGDQSKHPIIYNGGGK